MPTYEYECKVCSHRFEIFQNMSEEPVKTCVKCGKSVRRLINGGAGIIFKGSGFYVTDSKGSSSSGLLKSKDTENKTTESKTTESAAKEASTSVDKTEKSEKPKETLKNSA